MSYSISVIIPNYNGRNLLQKNLPALIDALKFSSVDYEIIVTDDASTDDSVSFLEKSYPDLILIKHIENSGFSANANRGIKRATKQLSFLLNNDVTLARDYFVHQFSYFKGSDCFGVMGSICSPSGKLIDAAKYPKWRGCQIISTLNYSLKNPPENLSIPTYFLSGANALVDTAKLKLLEGFNEIYSPFYMEDVDLSMRAWRMGWKCYYEPKSLCYHDISHTISKHRSKNEVWKISKRNKFIFHEFHLGGARKLCWKISLFLNLFLRILIFDFRYYRAFAAYRKKKKEISLSVQNFSLPDLNKSSTLVVDEIQKAVRAYKKDFF